MLCSPSGLVVLADNPSAMLHFLIIRIALSMELRRWLPVIAAIHMDTLGLQGLRS
jgi:hypothetical protein